MVLTRSEPCDATPAELEISRLHRNLAENKTHKQHEAIIYVRISQASRETAWWASIATTRLLDGYFADKVHKSYNCQRRYTEILVGLEIICFIKPGLTQAMYFKQSIPEWKQ
jgi:hypothetical protein